MGIFSKFKSIFSKETKELDAYQTGLEKTSKEFAIT